jgi:thiol-disulfide isomerase/thioredoxin
VRAALLLAVVACASPAPPPPVTSAKPPAAAPVVETTPLAKLEASRDLDNTVVGAARTPTVIMLLASWCPHCRDELLVFDTLRKAHPHVRWLGLNYKPHEEYDNRGNAEAVRALAVDTPWLRIVPADDALFDAFGAPPKVPTIFVYDSKGTLVETFDRRDRPVPREQELDDLLRSID